MDNPFVIGVYLGVIGILGWFAYQVFHTMAVLIPR